MSTVRLADLAAVTHRSVDMLKNMTKAGNLPWDDSVFPTGSHRRFDAYHATLLVLLEMLTARNETITAAAEALRDQAHVVEKYLADRGNEGTQDRFIAMLHYAVADSRTGVRFEGTARAWLGTADELADLLATAGARLGQERAVGAGGDRTKRYIGGPFIAVASVGEAFRILKARAEAAGFVIDGRRIFAVAQAGSED